MNSAQNLHRFTSQLFTTDLAHKYSAPLMQTEQLPDTKFKRVISDRILLEHRFHQIAGEVPETLTVKAGLVINLGSQYQAERWIDGKFYQYRMHPGDFTIFPAGISYRVVWDRPQELLMVGLDPWLIQQTVLELKDNEIKQLSFPPDLSMFPQSKLQDPLVYQIGLAFKNELNTNASIDRLYIESMVNTLLIHVIKCHSCHPYSSPQLTNGLTQLRLKQILEYIHEHLTQNISLVELAEVVHMSSHHFANLFKRSTGLSPYQYVIQQRLDRAMELLKNTDRSIVDIAIQTGFANQSHLTTVFRKHLATTPKKYREML